MGVKTLLPGKIQNVCHEITSYHIFINNWNNLEKIISPNHLSSIYLNAIKQPKDLFDIIIMQNSRWPP